MPPEIDLFAASRGTVTAPAGCGKTQLIADSLKLHVGEKPVLILTHTNAGKGALEARLCRGKVPKQAYRISTIDSWAIRLISKFPVRSGHAPATLRLENPNVDYQAIRNAALNLLSNGDINDALRSTYSRMIVDEYQDCTLPQHHIVTWIATVLPTYVLGDPLQAIFGFREATVHWQNDVHQYFPPLAELGTPWRWLNAGAEPLGHWLLNARQQLIAGHPVDLRGAPPEVTWIQLPANANDAHTRRLEAARIRAPNDGTILIIGDSNNPQGHRLMASHTPGATTVEAVDLRDLTQFGRTFNPTAAGALTNLINFAAEIMTNLGAAALINRMDVLQRGAARKQATPLEAAALNFLAAPSFGTAIEALRAFEVAPNVRIYRPETLQVCKLAMQIATSGKITFYDAVIEARERNRHLGRPMSRRAVGSTLLLKGLEADAAVVLNPSVMNAQHLYVALTRGAKSLVICSQTPILTPAR